MTQERRSQQDVGLSVSGERPSQHDALGEDEPKESDTLRKSGPAPIPPPSGGIAAPPTSSRQRAALRLPVVPRETYEILGEHARGAIGRILRARDRRLGRVVAIKELRPEHRKEEERFVREALLTSRLEHPAIVPVHEAGRWPTGEPFLAMKLVVGRSLDDLLRESTLLEQRLALLRHVVPVAEAMAYAHSVGIIHRDLKPGNILIGSFGETVVIDWGLAKDMSEDPPAQSPEDTPTLSKGIPIVATEEGITMMGEVMGTPAYMPPEQARGLPVDERADVYALGAILYHLLAGVPPYEGAPQDVVRKVVHDLPVPLEHRQRGIPPDLLAIVKKAMARSVLERYRTAKELAEDLRNWTSGAVVRAHTYTTSDRLSRFVKRNRTAISVGAVATVVVLVVGAFAMRRVLRESDRAAAKQREAENAQKEAMARADELVLAEAKGALDRDPNQAIASLERLSASFSRWPEVRLVAADADLRGIARVLRGHSAAVQRGAFLPDGTLVTAGDDRAVRVWSSSPRSVESSAPIGDLDVSGAGVIAYGGRDGIVRTYRIASGENRIVAQHPRPIVRVLITPDARFVVSRAKGEHVRVTDTHGASVQASDVPSDDADLAMTLDGSTIAFVAQGKLVVRSVEGGTQRTQPAPGHTTSCSTFSPDGSLLAVGAVDGFVRVFAKNKVGYRDFVGHTGPVVAAAFRPNGELVTASADRTLRVWDIVKGTSRVLRGHEGDIDSMRLSPDGARAVTASADHTVRLWDLDREQSEVLRGPDDVVAGASFSPDGARVAAWSWDQTVRIWTLAERGARLLAVHDGAAEHVVFPQKNVVVSSGADRAVRITRTDGGAPITVSQSARITDLASSSSTIAAAEDDGSIHLFALDGREVQLLRGHAGAVRRVLFSPDGTRLASAGSDRTIQIWDVASGQRSRTFDQEAEIKALAFSPDGTKIASGGTDRLVHIWSIDGGAPQAWTGHAGEILAVAFTPAGTIVSGDANRSLARWDASGRAKFIDVAGGNVAHIALIGDGSTFATAGADPALRIWDAKTGEGRAVLRAHAGQIVDLAVSPDGKRVVTASTDTTLRLWELDAGSSRVLALHGDAVTAVAFSPDGHYLASASADHTVRLWSDTLPDDPEGLRAWIRARDVMTR
jgi:WD40 repeat protein/serine/threonine protein kinase